MSKSCVMSLVSANLRRGSPFLYFPKSKPWSTLLIPTANSVSYTSKPVRGLMSLTYSLTRFDFVSQTSPPEIQFPGGSPSEEELPSRPSKGPDLVPLEVPDLPSDPPPLGPPQTPGPEFPVPPSPSPPMPDTPDMPTPGTPPDVVPPEFPPPGIDPPTPGIDTPPPMGPTIM